MADQHPLFGENYALLPGEYFRGNKIFLCQCFRTGAESVDCSPKKRWGVCTHGFRVSDSNAQPSTHNSDVRHLNGASENSTKHPSVALGQIHATADQAAVELSQNRLVKFVPVVEIIQADGIFGRLAIVTNAARAENALSRFGIMIVTADGRIVPLDSFRC